MMTSRLNVLLSLTELNDRLDINNLNVNTIKQWCERVVSQAVCWCEYTSQPTLFYSFNM